MQQRRTRIKVCGLTQVDNAVAVEACGVDAIGLVFYRPSSRWVEPDQARRIAAALGPLTHRVGLFVDADSDWVKSVLSCVELTLLQFHGDESDAYCASFGRPFLKAIRVREGLDLCQAMAGFPSASGFLLDAYKAGVPGGTGEQFDWRRMPQKSVKPLVLAGGLNPTNVAEAMATGRIHAVDVSGGVESSAGIKDIDLVTAFVEQVRAADLAT